MTWIDLAWPWLERAAVGALIVLTLGSLATALCRQPVRRARLVELTLLGSLLVPWLGMLPAMPRWSLGLLPTRVPTGPASRKAAPVESIPTAVRRAIPAADGPADSKPIAKLAGLQDVNRARSVPVPHSPPYTISWLHLFVFAYLAGSAGFVSWWVLGQGLLWRLAREARPARASVRARFDGISGTAGVRVRLLESPRIGSPFTFTWWRPVILLPAALCEGNVEDLDYSLAHEWSHVERGDAWSWNLAILAGAALFYQPLFWWLRRQLRLCQDYLADDRAAALGTAEDYAAYLVRFARVRPHGRALPALGITDRRSNLYRRIVMLVQDREPLDRRCRVRWSLAVAASAAAASIVIAGLRLDAAPAADAPAAKDDTKDQPRTTPAKTEGETLHYQGKVKEKGTGRAIEGARVTVRRSLPTDHGGDRTIQETTHVTGAGGVYSFSIPPEQVAEARLYIELDVEHPDYAAQSGFGYSLALIREDEKRGERPFFENVELRPAKTVTGRVEAPAGTPVEGVDILAYSKSSKTKSGELLEYGSFAKDRTDKDGRFRLPITTPGLGAFWLLPKGYTAETHIIAPEKRGDFGTFVLKPGITVTGQAFDVQGKPLAGLFVVAAHQEDDSPESQLLGELSVSDQLGRRTETDAEGRFRFEPLPPGTYQVHPVDYQRVEGKGLIRRPLPGVFAPRKLTLKEGETPDPLEIRAAPHVVIEGGWFDSKGKPRGGWDVMILGKVDGQFWHVQGYPSVDGRFSAMVPHGLEHTQIDITTSEDASTRYRIGKNGKLCPDRHVMLGTLDHDIKDLEIIRYVAPIVIVKATGEDGRPIKNPILVGEYLEDNQGAATGMVAKNGMTSYIRFGNEGDGRYRTTSLTPDRSVKITVDAEVFEPESRTFKLPEGTTEEVTVVLKAKGSKPASDKDGSPASP
jgi:beta-lactamase regulating signal transducer with metallopeptidase domain